MLEDKDLKNNVSKFKTDQIKFIFGIVCYFIVVMISFIILCLLFPTFWLLWFVILLTVMILSLILLVNWHTQNFAYKCGMCGHEFRIFFLMNLVSPHGFNTKGGWKYLKCPKCYKRSRAAVIRTPTNSTI